MKGVKAMIPLIETTPRAFKSYLKFDSFLRRQQVTKTSRSVLFNGWAVTENGLKVNGNEYPMRDISMRQLLKTLGMPQKFYMEKAPTDMTIRDINRMRDEFTKDSEMIVYFQENNDGQKEVRGIAEPNFREMPYPKLLKSLPVKEKFKHASYSDWGIRITTTDPVNIIKVQKNDIIEVGSDLVYSDTGCTSLVGSPFFNRLVCTNGMVVREASNLVQSFRTRFTWRNEEEAWLRETHEKFNQITVDCKKLATVFKIMRDEPMEVLDGADTFMRKVRSAVTKPVFDSDEQLTSSIKDGEKEKKVINLGISIYVALAQITTLAKTLAFVERRKLEIMAGALVAMTLKAVGRGRIKTKAL